MNPIGPVSDETLNNIIRMRLQGGKVKDIAEKLGLKDYFVSSVWRTYKREKLEMQSDSDNIRKTALSMANEGLNANQIAAQLNLSVSAVRSWIYDARAYGKVIIEPRVNKPIQLGRKKLNAPIPYRNYDIWRRLRSGGSAEALAESFGISKARIYQIVKEVDARLDYFESVGEENLSEENKNTLLMSKEVRD